MSNSRFSDDHVWQSADERGGEGRTEYMEEGRGKDGGGAGGYGRDTREDGAGGGAERNKEG